MNPQFSRGVCTFLGECYRYTIGGWFFRYFRRDRGRGCYIGSDAKRNLFCQRTDEVEGGADICKGVCYFAGGAGGGFAAHAGGAEGFLDGVFADVEVAGELGDVAGVGFVGLYAELVEHVEDSGGESFCHLAGGDVHGVLAAHGGEDAV